MREETPDFRALVAAGPVHFMGVGGAGMCALAEAVVRAGGQVTACDRSPGEATEPLRTLGVETRAGHDPSHLEVPGLGALVITAAIPETHPELRRARELGIPVLKRAKALGDWVRKGRLAAVAGTHGKTTTTALLTGILAEAGMDPTGFVGGRVAQWGSHLRAGRDDLFVVEADEYDRSFHHLTPDVTVVTNLEADHLEIYRDLAGVRQGFRRFLDGVRNDGEVWGCADDPGASALLAGVGRGVRPRSYGLSAGSEIRGEGPRFTAKGGSVRVLEGGVKVAHLRLGVPGLHNLRNALGAAGAARSLGVSWEAIEAGVLAFRGVGRRFQNLGRFRGIEIVDDYAHHPTEVAAAVAAARAAFPRRRLVVVFQPHLYTRTRDFHQEFGQALAKADALWLTEIYPAREEPIPGVSADLVARAAQGAGLGGVRLHPTLDDLPEALAAELRSGDLCLTLGAGSIERVGPALARVLRDGATQRGEHA
jgi:UDP-N-acetylmuramate--alanine ligase